MTRIAKLYAAVLANPRASLAFREFQALVKAFGLTLERQRGSHRAWTHPRCARPLILQPRKDGNAKPYQVQEFLDMIEEAGLSIGE
ncbi:MAG: type II toxin-antitoxin system HicA family toxin [Sphingomonadaceae bacterium]|nr:type II toxin-antitoxin system HicA family toxin [Sphingomonadaceae bacterium]